MAAVIDFVDNVGPNTVEAAIKGLCKGARQVDVVVAFATKRGVEAILPSLSRVAANGRVRVVVGFYQGVTEPAALRALMRAARDSGGRLSALVARNPKLHRKVYAFKAPRRVTVLAGSSDLTRDGLLSEGESNVLLSFPARPDPMVMLARAVPELRNPRASKPLTPQLISEYERLRSKGASPHVDAGELARLLRGASPSRGRAVIARAPAEHGWLRDYCTGEARRQTSLAVEEQTGWDRKGWSWYAVPADRMSPGDRVLLFDLVKAPSWARIVVIKGLTRTALRTPDGRHFAAYAELGGRFKRRKISKQLWRELRATGLAIGKSTRMQTRKLTATQVAAVQSTFSRRAR